MRYDGKDVVGTITADGTDAGNEVRIATRGASALRAQVESDQAIGTLVLMFEGRCAESMVWREWDTTLRLSAFGFSGIITVTGFSDVRVRPQTTGTAGQVVKIGLHVIDV